MVLSGHRTADPRLDRLYREYFDDLVRVVRRAFGPGPPEPEDVVQVAFLRFATHKNAGAIRDPRSFLFIAARNFIFDHKRKRKLLDRYLADQIAYDRSFELEEITPERVVLAREHFDQLVKALRRLPKKQQVILAMSRIEGKTYAEISAETGWSPADICRQLKAGMKALAREVRVQQTQGGRLPHEGGPAYRKTDDHGRK